MKGKRRNKIKMPLKKIPKRKQSTLTERINLCHDIGRIELPNNLSALIVSSAQKTNETSSCPGMQMLSIPTTSKKSLPNSISIVSNGQNRLSSAMVPPLVSIVRSRSPLTNIPSSSMGYSAPSTMSSGSVGHFAPCTSSSMVFSTSKQSMISHSSSSRGSNSLADMTSSGIPMAKLDTPLSSHCNKTKTISSIITTMGGGGVAKGCHSMSSTGERLTWSLPTQILHQSGPVQCCISGSSQLDPSMVGTDESMSQDLRQSLEFSDVSNVEHMISSNTSNMAKSIPTSTSHLNLSNIKSIKPTDIIATSLKTIKPLNKSTVTEILHLPSREMQLDGKSKIYLKSQRFSMNKNTMSDVRLPIVPVRAPLLQPISPETKSSISGGKRSLLMLKKEAGDCGQTANTLNKRRKQEDKLQKENQNPLDRKAGGSARKSLSTELQEKGCEVSDDDDDVIITGVISVNDLERKTLTASRKGNRKDDKFGVYATNKRKPSTKGTKADGSYNNLRSSSLGNIKNMSSAGGMSLNDIKSNVFIDAAMGNSLIHTKSKRNDKSYNIKNKIMNEMLEQENVGDMNDARNATCRSFYNQNKNTFLVQRQFGNEDAANIKKTNIGVLLGNIKGGSVANVPDGYNGCISSDSRTSHASSDEILDWRSVLKIYENQTEDNLKKSISNESGSGTINSEHIETGNDTNVELARNGLDIVGGKVENGSGTDSGAEDDVLRDLREFLMLSEYKTRKPLQTAESSGVTDEFSLNLKTSDNIQQNEDTYSVPPSKLNSCDDSLQRLLNDASDNSAAVSDCYPDLYTSNYSNCESNNQVFTESEYYSPWHSYLDNYPKVPPNKVTKCAQNSKRLFLNDNDPMFTDTERYRFKSNVENKEKQLEEFQIQAGYLVKSDYGSNAMDMKTFRRLQNKKR